MVIFTDYYWPSFNFTTIVHTHSSGTSKFHFEVFASHPCTFLQKHSRYQFVWNILHIIYNKSYKKCRINSKYKYKYKYVLSMTILLVRSLSTIWVDQLNGPNSEIKTLATKKDQLRSFCDALCIYWGVRKMYMHVWTISACQKTVTLLRVVQNCFDMWKQLIELNLFLVL